MSSNSYRRQTQRRFTDSGNCAYDRGEDINRSSGRPRGRGYTGRGRDRNNKGVDLQKTNHNKHNNSQHSQPSYQSNNNQNNKGYTRRGRGRPTRETKKIEGYINKKDDGQISKLKQQLKEQQIQIRKLQNQLNEKQCLLEKKEQEIEKIKQMKLCELDELQQQIKSMKQQSRQNNHKSRKKNIETSIFSANMNMKCQITDNLTTHKSRRRRDKQAHSNKHGNKSKQAQQDGDNEQESSMIGADDEWWYYVDPYKEVVSEEPVSKYKLKEMFCNKFINEYCLVWNKRYEDYVTIREVQDLLAFIYDDKSNRNQPQNNKKKKNRDKNHEEIDFKEEPQSKPQNATKLTTKSKQPHNKRTKKNNNNDMENTAFFDSIMDIFYNKYNPNLDNKLDSSQFMNKLESLGIKSHYSKSRALGLLQKVNAGQGKQAEEKSKGNDGKRGILTFQTEQYSEEQLQHIHEQCNGKQDIENTAKMIFGDNDVDNLRGKRAQRKYNRGEANIIGEYDRSFAYGITTTFYRAKQPNITKFKSLMDKQFITLQQHLVNGSDVVIPKPRRQEINRNRKRYYKDGQQVIFHSIGIKNEALSFECISYIQTKIDELRHYARNTRTCKYYNYNHNSKKKEEQLMQQQNEIIREKLQMEKEKNQMTKQQNQLQLQQEQLDRKSQSLASKMMQEQQRIEAQQQQLRNKQHNLNEIERELKNKEHDVEDFRQRISCEYIKWKVQDNVGTWNAYDVKNSAIIERLQIGYTHQIRTQFQHLKIKKLSSTTAEELNVNTNTKRRVKRFTDAQLETQMRKVKEMQKENGKLRDTVKKVEKIYKENESLRKMAFIDVWQWKENDGTWKSYDNVISTKVESIKIGQSFSYKFDGNGQMYKITKLTSTTGEQMNVETKMKRSIKRIQLKRYMMQDVEYPEWWNKSDINKTNVADPNYAEPKLKTLRLDTKPGIDVVTTFLMTCPNLMVIKVESVENQMLYDSYWNARKKLVKLIGMENLNERNVFHGTGRENVMESIQKEGFRKEFNSTFVYGQGTYFARDASYSANYSCKNDDGIYKMFMCKVMMGESHLGNSLYNLKTWPKKDGGKGLIYDSLINRWSDPYIFVIHENVRAYPMFVIHFKVKD